MSSELDPLELLSLQATLSQMIEAQAHIRADIGILDAKINHIMEVLEKQNEKMGVNDGSADFPPN